ncbi:MAG: hypothetical protein HY322_01560 [Betaproteobacteria bacterium]|nr:hypothetical protein [Betaproteobacteria bacterium]
MIGVGAPAGGMQGWLLKKTLAFECWLLIIAGLALVYPQALFDYIGIAPVVVAVTQKLRKDESRPAAVT